METESRDYHTVLIASLEDSVGVFNLFLNNSINLLRILSITCRFPNKIK